ncbi:MAG: HlyD family efflux transporter periplasmic adaptor subunit [Pseudomonadota bacterium]
MPIRTRLFLVAWCVLTLLQSAHADSEPGLADETMVVVQSPWVSPADTRYATNATLRSRYVIEYKVRTAGVVTSILSPGDTFAMGDSLVTQANPQLQLSLERNEFQALELKAERDITQLEVDKLDALVNSNTVSALEADTRRLSLFRAQARLDAQHMEVKRLQQLLTDMKTRAVRPGRVIEQHTNLGEYVEEGASLVTTVDMSAAQYWITLPFKEAADLNTASYITEAENELVLKIAALIPSGKATITAVTEEFDASRLPLGHLATKPVTAHLFNQEQLSWFHRDAVIEGESTRQVKVVDEKKRVVIRPIEIKAQAGQFVGVAGSFADGEKVLLRGMDAVNPGDAFRIIENRSDSLREEFSRLRPQLVAP